MAFTNGILIDWSILSWTYSLMIYHRHHHLPPSNVNWKMVLIHTHTHTPTPTHSPHQTQNTPYIILYYILCWYDYNSYCSIIFIYVFISRPLFFFFLDSCVYFFASKVGIYYYITNPKNVDLINHKVSLSLSLTRVCVIFFFNTYASMIYECMFNIHKFLSGSLSKNNAMPYVPKR